MNESPQNKLSSLQEIFYVTELNSSDKNHGDKSHGDKSHRDKNHGDKSLGDKNRIRDRQCAETPPYQSESHFLDLVNAAPVGIFQTDIDGNCLYVNDRWCQITGILPQEAKGHGWIQGIHPEDRDRVKDHWYSAKEKFSFRLEYRFQTSEGSVHWVLGEAVTETDMNGQIRGYIGTLTDISECKQAEFDLKRLNQELEARAEQRTIELKARQENYNLRYQKTPVMLHSIDSQGRLCSISNHWLERLGYTAEEVIGRKLTDFLTPESRDLEETIIFPQFLETGVCSEVPYQILSKSGELIDVLLSATSEKDQSGQHISLAVMVDVTERRQIEQALFREKELAQVTLHSIGDAVITTNALGVVEYFNPVAEQLTGWIANSAIGRPLREVFNIVHETTREPVENPIGRVLREETSTGLANHTILIAKDGTEFCIEDSAAPIRDRNQNMIGAVLVFHDVTHSRLLARPLGV